MELSTCAFCLVKQAEVLFCIAESLSSLLWNLHKYYSQFSESIQARITQLRQPVEKELKV